MCIMAEVFYSDVSIGIVNHILTDIDAYYLHIWQFTCDPARPASRSTGYIQDATDFKQIESGRKQAPHSPGNSPILVNESRHLAPMFRRNYITILIIMVRAHILFLVYFHAYYSLILIWLIITQRYILCK